MTKKRNITTVEVRAILAEAGLRPSPQRVAVLTYVASHPVHPTAEEIHSALVDEYPTLSKTTVYNILHLFAETGIIEELQFDATQAHFDYAPVPHAHFQCRHCGCIIDIEQMLPEPATTEGMHIANVMLCYKGLCEKCYKEQCAELSKEN